MATTDHLLNLNKDISCSICLQFFRDPVFLDCGHNFCQDCISSFWQNGECSCPECRCFFPDRTLKPNRLLASIVGNVRSIQESAWDTEWKKVWRGTGTSSRDQISSGRRRSPEAPDLKRKVYELTQQFEWEFAELHQILNKEEYEMKQRLNKRGEELLDRLTSNSRLANDNDRTVLQMIWNLLKVIMLPPSINSKETRQENRIFSNILAGEFGGPVQHMVWKQMRKSVNPVLSPLTLDLNSAHPRLIISNLTTVRLGYGEQPLPKSAKRFGNRMCVLGARRITCGKHYWEVEVDQGAKWTVGIARESVGRQDLADMTVQNGYWVISPHRSNWIQAFFDFFAQTDRSSTHMEHLELQVNPTKVGVYLDHEEGQVSFYNANTMSHLYTHRRPMSGPVFPFFGPGLSTNNWMRLPQP